MAILLDIDLVFGILACACMVVLLMCYLERRDSLPADTILGLLCHGSLATGLVALAFFPIFASICTACCSAISSALRALISLSSGSEGRSLWRRFGSCGGRCR